MYKYTDLKRTSSSLSVPYPHNLLGTSRCNTIPSPRDNGNNDNDNNDYDNNDNDNNDNDNNNINNNNSNTNNNNN